MKYNAITSLHIFKNFYIDFPLTIRVIAVITIFIGFFFVLYPRYSATKIVSAFAIFFACFNLFARLAYYFSPAHYGSFDFRFNCFMRMKGGNIWFVGILAMTAAAWPVAKMIKINYYRLLDILIISFSLWIVLDPIACFFQNCCWGLPTTLPFGVFHHNTMRHPAQLYFSAFGILYLNFNWVLSKSKMSDGWLFSLMFFLSSLAYIGIEHLTFRRWLWGPLKVSQYFGMIGCLVGLIFSWKTGLLINTNQIFRNFSLKLKEILRVLLEFFLILGVFIASYNTIASYITSIVGIFFLSRKYLKILRSYSE